MAGQLHRRFVHERRFALFLSHQKVVAGILVRWLQLTWGPSFGGSQRIFIDSDDLIDLDELFDIVKMDVELLVVLLTKEVPWRPWTAGEITTARNNGVPLFFIILPGAEGVLENVPQDVDIMFSGDTLAVLQPYYMSLDDVRSAYADLPSWPSVDFNPALPLSITSKRADNICKQISDALDNTPIRSSRLESMTRTTRTAVARHTARHTAAVEQQGAALLLGEPDVICTLYSRSENARVNYLCGRLGE